MRHVSMMNWASASDAAAGVRHRNASPPLFGDRWLDLLTAEDGLAYITARLEAKAAPWTIHREWTVFVRILNLAVDFDKLDKNRLKRVQLPDVSNRERVASREELALKAQSRGREATAEEDRQERIRPHRVLADRHGGAEYFWRRRPVLWTSAEDVTSLDKVSNSSKHRGEIWWSQRDSNPCLSLERTDESEEKQQDDSSGASDE